MKEKVVIDSKMSYWSTTLKGLSGSGFLKYYINMVITEEAHLKNLRRASLFNSLGESGFLR